MDPSDRLLEIGCGRGTAVALICLRLAGGRITAIDRSPTMVRLAEQRNADQVATGRAVFRTEALERADFAGERFDKIFAINVNLFWVRSSVTELDHIRRLLRPGGALYLFYEPPTTTRARGIAERVTALLGEHGFPTTTRTAVTSRGTSVLAIIARPR